jgi:hypothetical protein
MSMRDPGLDRHEWESEYASVDAELRDDPEQGLPQLADLVERMLADRQVDPDASGDTSELVAEYRSARETADRVERGGADPGDIAAAIESLRGVFRSLVVERSAP